jgi:hypothetical protein
LFVAPVPPEVKLAAQIELHGARIKTLDAEIASLKQATAKFASVKKMDEARVSFRDLKKREKTRDLVRGARNFGQETLEKIGYVSEMSEMMLTIGQASERESASFSPSPSLSPPVA